MRLGTIESGHYADQLDSKISYQGDRSRSYMDYLYEVSTEKWQDV